MNAEIVTLQKLPGSRDSLWEKFVNTVLLNIPFIADLSLGELHVHIRLYPSDLTEGHSKLIVELVLFVIATCVTWLGSEMKDNYIT